MMLLKDAPVRQGGRRYSPTEQAKALAVVLSEEFGVPFVFYDVSAPSEGSTDTSTVVWEAADEEERPTPLATETIAQVAGDGRTRVLPLGPGRCQLALPLYEAGRAVLVASGDLSFSAEGRKRKDEKSTEPPSYLQKWGQAVADRLRLADQLSSQRRTVEDHAHQAAACWEGLLVLQHVIGRLRIHKEPARNQRRILEAAFGLVNAQAIVWVPQGADAVVVVHGGPSLASADCHQLVALLPAGAGDHPGEPFLCNDVSAQSWGARFPQLGNLLALPVVDQGPIGWLLAFNKRASEVRGQRSEVGGQEGLSSLTSDLCPLTSFRKSDAALLLPFAALLGLHLRASERYHDLKDLLVGLTRSLTSALDAKDSYTYGHSERVARIAVELGREIGLSEDELGDIYLTGLLHDVGKIGVRDTILSKSGPLTPEEFEHIKQHVTIGYTILADLRPIRNLLPGVLYHHERVDGTGYPDGLTGEAIPLLARILAVADGYDAMSTTRPYRQALPCRKVEEILMEGAGKQWDKRVVEAFLRCRLKIHAIRQRGVGDSLRQAIDGALRKDGSSLQWNPGRLPG